MSDAFEESGRYSKVWWLAVIEKRGAVGSINRIAKAERSSWITVNNAVKRLVDSGYIETSTNGKTGPARRDTYSLTPLGRSYLSEQQDDSDSQTSTDSEQKADDPEQEAVEAAQVLQARRDEFEDTYDCGMCRNAGALCRLHEGIEQDEAKAAASSPSGYDGACKYCRRRGGPCVRHGGERSGGPYSQKNKDQINSENKAATTVTVPPTPKLSPNPTRQLTEEERHANTERVGQALQAKTSKQSTTSENPPRPQSSDNPQPTDNRASFKQAFQEVLIEILLERYGDQVTAKEVIERLEKNHE